MSEGDELVIYQAPSGAIGLPVDATSETIWATQKQIAEVFDVNVPAISKHIANILEEGELTEATISKRETVQQEGDRMVRRNVDYYNLDMIIAIGYRISSGKGTAFRKWATKTLSEYIIKGFAMDDERLKGNAGGNHWKELLERIRDIRSSEKAIYRQVLDLYALSADYDPKSPATAKFFKIFQNKLHYATSQQTAAEIVHARADSTKDFMGMTTFAGAVPTLREASIAKNYLTEDELFVLNRLVSAFFDLAEIRAKQKQAMRMQDWVDELDKFSLSYGKGTLVGAGSISHGKMVKRAVEEYRKYEARTLSPVEKAYLESIKAIQPAIEKKVSKNNQKKGTSK